mgnify:CR=1 FL=1
MAGAVSVGVGAGVSVAMGSGVGATVVGVGLGSVTAGGVTSSATVAGGFVFGLPSLIAVLLNYLKRSDVRGTWLESHFVWQIRTFWFTLLWLVLSFLVMLTIIGIPIAAWVMIPVLGLWVGYRVLRGWLALSGGRQVGV